MAYTKQDYDNVVSLYREYESKKDSYTPIQQQQIENAFANAWSKVSQRTEESNYKQVVGMRMDPQGNTVEQYSDGTEKIVQLADKPDPEIINTNNVNVPETTQAGETTTQITIEPAETQTPTQVQQQTQTPIAKPAISTPKTGTNGRTGNSGVYPVGSAKNGGTLMSDGSVRPATYNPQNTQPSNAFANKFQITTPLNKNLQRLIGSGYTYDNKGYLYNPSGQKIAKIGTGGMASNP